MSQTPQHPARPPTLHPEHTYVHVTSPQPPASLSNAITPGLSGGTQLRYVGPVGELDGEHIFEVMRSNQPLKRDTPDWTAVKDGLVKEVKAADGVKAAKILEQKQRMKRGGEL